MSCREVEEFLSFALEGELNPEERQILETHLKTCPACSSLFSLMKETRESLAGFPELEVSEALLSRLNAIPKKKKFRFSLDFLLRPTLQPVFAAATIFLIMITFYAFHPNRKNINRAVDRQLHLGYSQAEKLYAKAGSFADRLGEYKDDILDSIKKIKIFGGEKD